MAIIHVECEQHLFCGDIQLFTFLDNWKLDFYQKL